MPAAAPWQARRAEAGTPRLFQTWMRRNLRTQQGRALMEGVTEAVWAAEPADVSLLHILFYIASAGGLDPLISTEGGRRRPGSWGARSDWRSPSLSRWTCG